MGSHMKKTIFEEQTANALKKWQKAAKDRRRLRKAAGGELDIASTLSSPTATPSRGSSPLPLLHKYKFNSSNNIDEDIEIPMDSPPHAYHFETDLSDIGDHSPPLASSDDQGSTRPMSPIRNYVNRGDDFTFASP